MNRKSQVLVIGILVFLYLVLAFTTLYYSSIYREDNNDKIIVPYTVDNLYVIENEVNYHLNEILDNIAVNYEGGGETEFLYLLRNGIDSYVVPGDYVGMVLLQVKNNIEPESYNFNENGFSITFRAVIEDRSFSEEKERIYVKYEYEKTFTKVFKEINVL